MRFLIIILILLSLGFINKKNIKQNKNTFGFIVKQFYIEEKCKKCKNSIPNSIRNHIKNLNNFFYFNAISRASSWIIYQDKVNYMATAMHVCDTFKNEIDSDSVMMKNTIEENIELFAKGISKYWIFFEISIRNIVYTENVNADVQEIIIDDNSSDFCIFSTNKKWSHSASISKTPSEYGDLSYSISAPNGFFSKKGIISYIGLYNGKFYDKQESDIYSIYSMPGSSGSPIFNPEGYIVGSIHSTVVDNNSISFSTSLQIIKNSKKKLIDIIKLK